jgi:hypothetical protein
MNGTLVLVATVIVVGTSIAAARHWRTAIAHWFAPRRRQARINELESQLRAAEPLIRRLTDALNDCADQRDRAVKSGIEARGGILAMYDMLWDESDDHDVTLARLAAAETELEAFCAFLNPGVTGRPALASVPHDHDPSGVPVGAEAVLAPAGVGDEELDAWREVAELVPVSEYHSGFTGAWPKELVEAAFEAAGASA